MNTINKYSRILGAAFLLQAVTSLISGMIMKQSLTVPGNISETMIKIAKNAWLMRVNILGEIITAAGIIFLGAILFVTLRKLNKNMSLVAFGLYILEATILAASRIPAFLLLRISQSFVTSGNSNYLQTIGSLAFESMNFGYTMLMLPFCIGGIIFYYLLYKSRIVPQVLSLWGLIAVFPCLVGTLSSIFGYQVPFAIYLPYAPFEFVIGIWILIKGIKISEVKSEN